MGLKFGLRPGEPPEPGQALADKIDAEVFASMTANASFAPPASSATIYVVFQASQLWRRFAWFLRDGYQHCWTFQLCHWPEPGLMADEISLKIEVNTAHIDCQAWPERPEVVAAAFLKQPAVTEIWCIDVARPQDLPYIPRGFATCVSVTKAIIGMKAPLAITPWQLRQAMLKRGARRIEG